MDEIETDSACDDSRGRHGSKRKSVDKLSGAARCKLAKEVTLKISASKCFKLTSFLTKLPVVQPAVVPTEECEDKPVSDDQHSATSSNTEPTETEATPAPGLEHNMQTDPEYEEVEEQSAADIIQEQLLPQSEFPPDPGLYTNTSLTTRLVPVRKLCKIGPCQPGLNEPFQFPTDEFGRKFLVT